MSNTKIFVVYFSARMKRALSEAAWHEISLVVAADDDLAAINAGQAQMRREGYVVKGITRQPVETTAAVRS